MPFVDAESLNFVGATVIEVDLVDLRRNSGTPINNAGISGERVIDESLGYHALLSGVDHTRGPVRVVKVKEGELHPFDGDRQASVVIHKLESETESMKPAFAGIGPIQVDLAEGLDSSSTVLDLVLVIPIDARIVRVGVARGVLDNEVDDPLKSVGIVTAEDVCKDHTRHARVVEHQALACIFVCRSCPGWHCRNLVLAVIAATAGPAQAVVQCARA
mmetsp:Transcript_15488/g.36858  ORF Transcript_15488/g.36858 Transcript_15488/m.36858 type:complete len:217 (+) Transcript_15488:235-885(+)